MPKLVCYFSGWFEIDVDKVRLIDLDTDEINTAEKILQTKGSISNCMLESFETASANATDGEFEELTLSIEVDCE